MSKNIDYLIVGLGIAGVTFAKHCLEKGKSFKIVTDQNFQASHVAAGMFNPIILFRFTTIHRAQEQMDQLLTTFRDFENLLNQKLIHPKKIYRIFANEYETKIWQKKIRNKPILQKFLNPEIISNTFEAIHAPYGFGEVMHCGWIDMSLLIESFKHQFSEHIINETFDYGQLGLNPNSYRDIEAKYVVFSEGVRLEENPWFNHIPIIKNKGEILILEINQTLPDIIFKSKNFLMPLGDSKYYVGATYDVDWKTDQPTEKNKKLLLEKLETYYPGDYKIIDHRAAFRPTVEDRRGVIGEHPHHPNLFVLNGMGTRGSFNAPSLSKYLFNAIENDQEIPKEYRVSRFNDLL